MVTKEKIQQVAELEDRLKRAVITIGLDYRGLTVAQMRDLRLALRAQEPSMELRVVKNTLLKRAAENCGHAPAADLAVQSTALLLGYEEEINPPKALSKFLRDKRLEITIHGGYLDGALLSPSDVITLATTPSRRELMGLLAGGLSSPLVGIAMVLQDVFREIAAGIEARAKQLEESSAADGQPEESPGADALAAEGDSAAEGDPDATA